jgi:hypothetical protein
LGFARHPTRRRHGDDCFAHINFPLSGEGWNRKLCVAHFF